MLQRNQCSFERGEGVSMLLKNQKLKVPIRILAISDLHFWDKEELNRILDYEFDVCVLLGDIPYIDAQ